VRRLAKFALLLVALGAAACSKEEAGKAPPALAITDDATGYYCGMLLTEHPGPKGQIQLQSGKSPVWFSSVRDTFTFLRLPEEPKDVIAIYVSDMAKAPSWEEPGSSNWIAASDAMFVVGSDREGGMGGAEAVPFGARGAAEKFIAEHGGKIVDFEEAKKEMSQ